jgi:carbonic anhydrase/acetyltransferase-like protein (isoleucine patch superfamily)
VGDSAIAEIAYEYFTHDSPYEVVGVRGGRGVPKRDELFGLPSWRSSGWRSTSRRPSTACTPPWVTTSSTGCGRASRPRPRQRGYALASYVSSRAFVWRNVEIGEHCFIFEDNTVQPFVRIGDDVVLWSGNHIGHHSVIRDHVFVASHVVISGFCDVGAHSFVGVNATVANNVTIAADNLLGAGCTILRDTEPNKIYGATATAPAGKSARAYFKVPEDAA